MFNAGDTVRHLETGTIYKITETHCVIESTLTAAYAYKQDGMQVTWVRPKTEMEDGRFERI